MPGTSKITDSHSSVLEEKEIVGLVVFLFELNPTSGVGQEQCLR